MPARAAGPPLARPGDHDPVGRVGREQAEPGAWRTIDPAEAQEVVEDRRQEVGGHDHVADQALPLARHLLDQERADADEIAGWADAGGPAPMRVSRRGEQGGIEIVLPVAGERPLGDQPRAKGVVRAAAAGHHQ